MNMGGGGGCCGMSDDWQVVVIAKLTSRFVHMLDMADC